MGGPQGGPPPNYGNMPPPHNQHYGNMPPQQPPPHGYAAGELSQWKHFFNSFNVDS